MQNKTLVVVLVVLVVGGSLVAGYRYLTRKQAEELAARLRQSAPPAAPPQQGGGPADAFFQLLNGGLALGGELAKNKEFVQGATQLLTEGTKAVAAGVRS